MKRIRGLLRLKGLEGAWTPLLAGVIFLAIVAVGMNMVLQARQGLAERHLPIAVETQPTYEWINGPVSYLVTPHERAVFESLTTNEARGMFIRQFWQRRNPNPGSRVNNFKEEFYRRVQYANAHFAYSHPGWMSNRGHMYILYGPPDQIQFHPNGTPYQFSVWTYSRIPGVGQNVSFTFIDKAGNGGYRLASPPWK